MNKTMIAENDNPVLKEPNLFKKYIQINRHFFQFPRIRFQFAGSKRKKKKKVERQFKCTKMSTEFFIEEALPVVLAKISFGSGEKAN